MATHVASLCLIFLPSRKLAQIRCYNCIHFYVWAFFCRLYPGDASCFAIFCLSHNLFATTLGWIYPDKPTNNQAPCWYRFLAHLSRRLTRWAYSIPMVRRPSVVVHTFKLEYLWSQLANVDQILYEASLGWGKGCIRFWGRLNENAGFHGNRKPPLIYNGENDVSTFSRLFFIWSFLYLQVMRTCIKSRTSLNFGQIWRLTTELAALEHLKNFPYTYNGKMLSPC